MPHNSAFATQGRAQDALRWGGRTAVAWGPHSPVGGNTGPQLQQAVNLAKGQLGNQLVNAHWRWPLTWQTLVCIVPQFSPDEVGAMVVRLDWTLGSGDAQNTFQTFYTVSLDPTTGLYTSVIDTETILPGADVQVVLGALLPVAEASGLPALTTTSVDVLDIGVFVAPQTEAHALLLLLEGFSKDERFGAGEREGGWMPPGFNEEPLGYRR
jgi:hypothetical protein